MYSGMKIYFLSQISSLKQILPVLKTSEVAKQFPWFPFSKTCSLCKLGESQAHSLVAPAPEYLVEHLASFPSEKPWSPLREAMEPPPGLTVSHQPQGLTEPSSGLDSNGQFTDICLGNIPGSRTEVPAEAMVDAIWFKGFIYV